MSKTLSKSASRLAPSKRIEKELRVLLSEPQSTPHSPFLSEVEMCRHFDVNVATARKAVRRLVEEGLIYKRHRIGTFVAPTSRNRLVLLVTTNPEFSTVGRLTPIAARYPELRWQEVVVDELRANLEEIELIYPRLSGVLFVRDLPKCIDVIRGLQAKSIPTFFYGSDVHLPFLKFTQSLLYNESEIVGLAMDHLRAAGARSIGFLGADDWAAFSARHEHYLRWLHDRKVSIDPANIIVMPHPVLQDPLRCYEDLKLRLKARRFSADAILCSNDQCATIMVQAALAAGFAIPGDLQVIGIEDDELLSTRTFPQITSVRLPFAHDIQEAFENLSRPSAESGSIIRLTSRPHLVARQSTRPTT